MSRRITGEAAQALLEHHNLLEKLVSEGVEPLPDTQLHELLSQELALTFSSEGGVPEAFFVEGPSDKEKVYIAPGT